MATYVPQMEKARNTFILDAKNGMDDLLRWCQKFEFDLNLISYSFIKSISRLSQNFSYQTNEHELIHILNSFNSFLSTIENNFNSQLESVIHKYHSLKTDYAACIENDLDTINEGIKEALIFQMKYKQIKNSKNSLFLMKEKVKLFREEIEKSQEEINHIKNCFFHSLTKLKERKQKLTNLLENESKKFYEKKENFENEIKTVENEAKVKPKNKTYINNNNNYYLLINNIENETEFFSKLKIKHEREIKEIKAKNENERKKYINAFKEIHDKICQNMDEVNSIHKELEQLRFANEREEARIRSLYNSEEKKIREENQKIFDLKKEVQLIIDEVNRKNEIECNKQREYNKRRIEIEMQNDEIELKNYRKILIEKNQKKLNEINSMYDKISPQKRLEDEYEARYNDYIQQLTSPVFSTAIGYQKSQDVTNLLAKKDSLLSNISNERSLMITKSKSEIVPKNSSFIHQGSKPKNFIQILNDEKNLLKKLYSEQIESINSIKRKEKESRFEIRKMKKELSMARRFYLTKKLILMDSLEFSIDYSKLNDQLKNDEKFDSQIENLEDKISFQINLCDTKNSLNYKKVRELENELDHLNDTLYHLFEKYAKMRKQLSMQKNEKLVKLTPSPKNEKVMKNMIRAKSSQSPNLISPVSSRYGKQKINITKQPDIK